MIRDKSFEELRREYNKRSARVKSEYINACAIIMDALVGHNAVTHHDFDTYMSVVQWPRNGNRMFCLSITDFLSVNDEFDKEKFNKKLRQLIDLFDIQKKAVLA